MNLHTIQLRPLPWSSWLAHDPAFGTSTVSIEGEAHRYPTTLAIVGVKLNGVDLKHKVINSLTVTVSPMIPMEGGRLEVLCTGANWTPEPLQWLAPAHPTLPDAYGLQRPRP